jgi:hypothetical protein
MDKMQFRVDRGFVSIYETEPGRLMVSFDPYRRDEPNPAWPGSTQEASSFADFPREDLLAGGRAAVLAWIKRQPFGQPLESR